MQAKKGFLNLSFCAALYGAGNPGSVAKQFKNLSVRNCSVSKSLMSVPVSRIIMKMKVADIRKKHFCPFFTVCPGKTVCMTNIQTDPRRRMRNIFHDFPQWFRKRIHYIFHKYFHRIILILQKLLIKICHPLCPSRKEIDQETGHGE